MVWHKNLRALPLKAIAIKVGNVSEAVVYNLPAQPDVLPFLREMIDHCRIVAGTGRIG